MVVAQNLIGMRQMKDKSFIDTNVFLYAIDKDANFKHKKALEFLCDVELKEKIHVSYQVLKEFTNAAVRRKIFNESQLVTYLDIFSGYRISGISLKTIKEAIRIKFRYQLSFYDSLIVATAIENNCTRLYSEDLNNGQSIEGLQIINPFQEN